MADAKQTDKKQNDIKEADMKKEEKKEEKILYKLIKNVKYGGTPHKIGEKIEIKAEDLEEFKAAKAIKIEE